jgi:aminoglycoside phosphotransferase (APT) family kinase protein
MRAWLSDLAGREVQCDFRPLKCGPGSVISLIRSPGESPWPDLIGRMIVLADWLQREPDLIAREARALRLVERLEIQTPRSVACDPDGTRLGFPAIVMTRVPGRSWPERRPPERHHLEEMARTLRTLHSTDFGEDLLCLPPYRPHHWRGARTFQVPAWSRKPTEWQRSIDVFNSWNPARSDAVRNLIHRDYRPANLLWSAGRVTAIIDWVTAARGDGAADVGHCRWNLWRSWGEETADAFTELYGADHYDPVWDILAAVGSLPDVVPNRESQASRSDAFIASALARFKG